MTRAEDRAREHSVNSLSFELTGVFSFLVSPLELMLRGTLMYWERRPCRVHCRTYLNGRPSHS